MHSIILMTFLKIIESQNILLHSAHPPNFYYGCCIICATTIIHRYFKPLRYYYYYSMQLVGSDHKKKFCTSYHFLTLYSMVVIFKRKLMNVTNQDFQNCCQAFTSIHLHTVNIQLAFFDILIFQLLLFFSDSCFCGFIHSFLT